MIQKYNNKKLKFKKLKYKKQKCKKQCHSNDPDPMLEKMPLGGNAPSVWQMQQHHNATTDIHQHNRVTAFETSSSALGLSDPVREAIHRNIARGTTDPGY